ncbi:hypothetical protein MRX96_041032 [Rhipicephalus microplus]
MSMGDDETPEGTGTDAGTASAGTAADTGTGAATPEEDPTFKGSSMQYCIGIFLIGLFVFLVYTVVGALANIEINFDIPFLTRGKTTAATTAALETKNQTANETSLEVKRFDDDVDIKQLRDGYYEPYEGVGEEDVRVNYGR